MGAKEQGLRQCYYCFNQAIKIRHDTPRCQEHLPIVTLEPEKDEAPKTPRTPGLFGSYGSSLDDWINQQGM